MKKFFFPGLVAGIAMLVIGMAFSYLLNWLFPSLAAEYNNVNLFRPWKDPLMSLYFLHPFVLGWIMAWVWNKLKDIKVCVSEKCKCDGGVYFGLCFWVVTLPGMVITYGSFKVSLAMVLSWTVAMLLGSLAAGWILAKMNKRV